MKSYIKQFLRSRNWTWSQLPPSLAENPALLLRPSLATIVESFFGESASDWEFAQIGAFDGQHSDELKPIVQRYSWRGVLIEPQPAAFQRLKQFYADQPQLRFANVAIADTTGERTMYTVAGETDSPITSFDKSHVARHLRNGNSATEIRSFRVPAKPLSAILDECGIAHLDLLQIDAEGYDYHIVSNLEFERLKPKVIRYEHSHISLQHQDQLIRLLSDLGYRFVIEPVDTIAVRLGDHL